MTKTKMGAAGARPGRPGGQRDPVTGRFLPGGPGTLPPGPRHGLLKDGTPRGLGSHRTGPLDTTYRAAIRDLCQRAGAPLPAPRALWPLLVRYGRLAVAEERQERALVGGDDDMSGHLHNTRNQMFSVERRVASLICTVAPPRVDPTAKLRAIEAASASKQ